MERADKNADRARSGYGGDVIKDQSGPEQGGAVLHPVPRDRYHHCRLP